MKGSDGKEGERDVLGEGKIKGEVLVGGFKVSQYRVGHMKLRRCENVAEDHVIEVGDRVLVVQVIGGGDADFTSKKLRIVDGFT